jgi:hypothetical protein
MAASEHAPFINKCQYSYGDITITVTLPDGTTKTYADVKEIKYTATREIAKRRGTSPFARGRTRGTLDFEGSMVMYKSGPSGFDQFVADLGDGWMEAEVDITVTYGNDDQAVTTDILRRVTFLKDEGGGAEGADDMEVSLDLDIVIIERNGKKPMKGMAV